MIFLLAARSISFAQLPVFEVSILNPSNPITYSNCNEIEFSYIADQFWFGCNTPFGGGCTCGATWDFQFREAATGFVVGSISNGYSQTYPNGTGNGNSQIFNEVVDLSQLSPGLQHGVRYELYGVTTSMSCFTGLTYYECEVFCTSPFCSPPTPCEQYVGDFTFVDPGTVTFSSTQKTTTMLIGGVPTTVNTLDFEFEEDSDVSGALNSGVSVSGWEWFVDNTPLLPLNANPDEYTFPNCDGKTIKLEPTVTHISGSVCKAEQPVTQDIVPAYSPFCSTGPPGPPGGAKTNFSTGTSEIFSVSMIPNPVLQGKSAYLEVNLEQSLTTDITLFDVTGKERWHQTTYLEKGTHALNMPTNSLNPGVYIVKIASDTHEIITRVLVQ